MANLICNQKMNIYSNPRIDKTNILPLSFGMSGFHIPLWGCYICDLDDALRDPPHLARLSVFPCLYISFT